MEDFKPQSNQAGVIVRRLKASELPQLLRVESRCYPDDAWPVDEFVYRLYDSRSTILVAIQAGKIVGFAVYARRWFKLHLENIAVDPSCRRQGIARFLVSCVIGDLPRQRRSRITLEVRKSNEAAQSCYRQLGFTYTGEKPGYYWTDGEDALLMEYRS